MFSLLANLDFVQSMVRYRCILPLRLLQSTLHIPDSFALICSSFVSQIMLQLDYLLVDLYIYVCVNKIIFLNKMRK